MSLTKYQKTQAAILKQQYMDIFTKWSQDPTNFQHTVSCLADLREFLNIYLKMLESVTEKAQATMNRGGLFATFRAGRQMKSGVKDIKKIAQTIYSADVKKYLADILAKEPRLTGLAISKKENQDQQIRGGMMLFNKVVHVETFSIQFSDNTQVDFHSLDDEKVLADAKKLFENKLESLAMGRRGIYGMN